MTLVKRNSDNWLPSVLDDMFKTDWLGGTNFENLGTQIPLVNIQENTDNFIVEVAAPGKQREDFNIELDQDVLSISSETKKETNEDRDKYRRREFSYNSFKRVFRLPETINHEAISASYKDGVLTIELPKREEAKVQAKRLIEVK